MLFDEDKNVNNNKIIKLAADNYVYLVTALISIFVLIICCFITRSIPYGDNFPIKGNGYLQDYAQFLKAVRDIKNSKGLGLIDYSGGLVSDNYGGKTTSITYYVSRPWLYLVYLLTPEALYEVVFALYYYLYFVISGPVFIYFLTHRLSGKSIEKNDKRLIILGLAYGLSSYAISYFVYCNFRFLVFTPIILLGVEKLIYEKKVILYIISLFYCMISEAYYAFILCVFVGVYFIVIENEMNKSGLKDFIRFILSSICAAGLSAFFLIPYYFRIKNSPYLSFDDTGSSLFGWFGNILLPLSDYRVAKEALWTSNTNYRANIYVGMLVILLFPLYFFIKDIKLFQRIKTSVVLLLLYFAFDNQFLNYIFHGFHFQWQTPNRFAFFFIFLILVCFYDVIIRLEDFSTKKILCCALCSGAVMILSYIIAFYKNVDDKGLIAFIPSAVCIAVYCLAVIVLSKKRQKLFQKTIYILMLIELIISGCFSLKFCLGDSEILSEEAKIENIKIISQSYEDMKDPFVITERPGEYFDQNFAYLSGVNSISYYTSASFSQQMDILYRWGILFSKNVIYYSKGSPLADMMLHVKYHIADSTDVLKLSPYQPIAELNGLYLCENQYSLPLGVFFDKNEKLDEWNTTAESYRNYSSAFERDNEFASCFGVDKIYDTFIVNEATDQMNANDSYYTKEENADGTGGCLYTFYIGQDTGGKIYFPIAQALEYVGESKKGESDILYFYTPQQISIDNDGALELGVWNEENFSELYKCLSKQTMKDYTYGSDYISGHVDVSGEGILYMAMPNLPGFKAYVNGKEYAIEKYMDGVGLRLDKGSYDIKIKYVPQGMYLGIIVSVVFAVILLFYCLYFVKKAKHSDNEKNE